MTSGTASFRGEFAYLSNFYPCSITFEGSAFRSVEHAYQAAKTNIAEEREMVARMRSAGAAKRIGQCVTIRDDWDEIKVTVMRKLVCDKFTNDVILSNKLIATYPTILVERNYWGDTFWGMYRGEGSNYLGKILMSIRNDLRSLM